MLSHRIKAALGAITTVGLLGLFALPGEVHAAIAVTVTDSSGAAVGGAFVAVLNSDGDAVDSAITAKDGTVSVNEAGGAGLVVAAPGFQTKTASGATAQTVALTASTKSKLSYANAFGAQVRTIAADGESGVYYATSDAQPTVWRTSDYAGSWSPVPTTADSEAGSATAAGAMPQTEAAGEIFTSGVKGEVAVQVGQNLYYSRTYGNTWSTIANYNTVTGQNKKHHWVHGGANAEYSYIVTVTESGMFIAVMPDSSSDAAPSFTNVTSTIGRYTAADRVAFAVGSTGDIFMATVNGSGTRISQITPAATAAALAATAGSLPQITPPHTMATTGTGLVKLSTLGTATPQALVTHLVDGATVSLTVGALVSGTWTMSTGVEGSTQANNLTLTGMSALSGNCGQNGGTPLVASIAPEAPSGSDVLNGFEVVGTIGQCMFVFNATGSNSLIGATFTSPKVALLAMEGANNNTGFVWDSGFNFSSNMVSLSGDGQFGLRKSAVISAGTFYRPSFGGAGGTTASQYINSQATAGTDVASGGIAVGGMVAPNVTDVVYSPNSTDGSQLVLSMTETGGSRTLLSTDGGSSFSTIGAGGSRSVEWWNGANGLQHIAAGFSNNANEFLHVKSFNTNSGAGKLDMGDELAATAALRDSKDVSTRKEFSFPGAANPSGSTLTPSSFASSTQPNQQYLLSAIEGIAGKDAMLVGVNKCSQNLGPSGCESSQGSVALVGLSANSSTGAVTISNVKYFGSEVAAGGATSAGSGTYAGDVKAIQYCPTGSATKVADTAFISVGGKGIYKITAVSTAPAHAATGTTTGTYKDLKVDCDTGVIAVAGSDGLYFSVDGAAKFVKVTTTAAPAGGQQPPQQGGNNAPTAVAVQADGTTGEVTMTIASGNGDIKSVETSFTALGVSAADTKAGTATTPTAAITPAADSVNELNNSSTGKNTGAVLDLEIPNTATDKVTAADVRSLSVRKFATASKLSAGTGGGAFKASLRTTTTSSGSGAGTPGVGGTTPGAVAAKVVTVKKGKTVSVTSALKTLGTKVVAKSKIVTTVSSASKKVCSVSKTNVVKGLKAGKCSLTVKVTPPATKKVKKPKTTTKKITITIK